MDFKLKKSDIYILLLYFAFAVPINCYDYADYDNLWDLFFENLLMVTSDSICIYLIIFKLFPYFFPRKKYIPLIVISILFLATMGFLFIHAYCALGECNGDITSLEGVYYGLTLVTESFTIPGLFILGKKLYEAQTTFLKIEKEKKESELLRLNAQIDPHFLFNNLNTIDSLIDTNPTGAKTYLNKLARLYRYLIATKDQEVVELEEELTFAQNYIYLIQSRFGNAYQFHIQH
ncbi:MAG: histidine kinase, partial [Bacteroidota bacterium]